MASPRVAVLTVSDTASENAAADKSGPAIREILAQHGHQCVHYVIVPDDEQQIRDMVKLWTADGGVDWIITTGGTGFGVRDKTPEAITPLLERQAPGIVHLIISTSLQKTSFAALSRPVAGTIKNTLITTLPGSVKAVNENLEALFRGGVVDHAIELIRGDSGKKVHAELSGALSVILQPPSSESAHPHHHHHDHRHDHTAHSTPRPRTANVTHDPSAPVSARHRISPFPLLSLEDALVCLMCEVSPLPPREQAVSPDLRGCVLAEDIYAPHDVPRMHTTNVDGYAVRSSYPPGTYKVLTAHTHRLSDPLPEGHIFRINTGAPLPAGADAVLMVEDTLLHSTRSDSSEEESEVEARAQVDPGENVRGPGSDVKQGDLVLEKGQVLHALGGEIGTLAFVGKTKTLVHPKPVVALLSTGNELLDLQAPVPIEGDGWGGIWDTNRPSLQAAIEGMGYRVIDLGIVADSLESHVAALKKGIEQADIVISTGGTSMGASDLLKPVIERHLNGTIHFGRVKVKPGKPTTLASVSLPKGKVPIFALPGNPASALVMFHIFVVPALRRLAGWPVTQCHLPRVKVKLQHTMQLDPRVEFHRVTIRAEQDGLKAYSTGGQRSSRVASLAGANGLVQLPPFVEDGPTALQAGEVADAVLIGELQSIY